MRKVSITRRLIVFVALTQVVLTVAVIALATYLMRWQLRTSFDAALHGRAMAVAALVRFSEDDPPKLIFDPRLFPQPIDSRYPDLFIVYGPDGQVIAKSPTWTTSISGLQPRNQSHWNARIDSRRFRVIQLKDIPVLDQEGPGIANSATITVIYAASTYEIAEHTWAMAILTSFGSLILLALATTATVWLVKDGLSPVAQLADSADHVTAADWKLNVPAKVTETVELAPLTAAMDRMLATLERAFTSQREFVTNAAHELKTPIAVLKSTLQLALQRPRRADEYQRELQNALEDVGRLETLTHSMLRLARAEQLRSGHRIDMPLVDLAASCEASAERWRPMAETKSVLIEIQSEGAPQVNGDPDDFETIWNNLLDNAIRYSPVGGKVRLSIARQNGTAHIEVEDQGPGIREQDLQNIFERFHRSDPSRSRETGGYGLGLAIAKAMVEAYGGSIEAKTRSGCGTTFYVELPVLS